jgi:hypothetical protein
MEPAGEPPARGPLFVVGANGTGTTLLRLMLDSHPHLAIPAETGFLRLAKAHRWVPYWARGGSWYGSLDLTEDELMARLAEFYGGLFRDFAARRGKQRWGDKTPFHVWHLDLALRMFPDATVIGIVRHPGATASSLERRFRRLTHDSLRHWANSTQKLLCECMDLGDRGLVLRYEELVSEPERVMRALLERIGEPWSDAVLRHHTAADGPTEVEGFTRADAAVTADNIDSWERHASADLRQQLSRVADLAAFLGYDVTHTLPLGSFTGSDGSPVLTGRDLLARRRTSTLDIDWRRELTGGSANGLFKPPAPPPRGRRRRMKRRALARRAEQWQQPPRAPRGIAGTLTSGRRWLRRQISRRR